MELIAITETRATASFQGLPWGAGRLPLEKAVRPPNILRVDLFWRMTGVDERNQITDMVGVIIAPPAEFPVILPTVLDVC